MKYASKKEFKYYKNIMIDLNDVCQEKYIKSETSYITKKFHPNKFVFIINNDNISIYNNYLFYKYYFNLNYYKKYELNLEKLYYINNKNYVKIYLYNTRPALKKNKNNISIDRENFNPKPNQYNYYYKHNYNNTIVNPIIYYNNKIRKIATFQKKILKFKYIYNSIYVIQRYKPSIHFYMTEYNIINYKLFIFLHL